MSGCMGRAWHTMGPCDADCQWIEDDEVLAAAPRPEGPA